MRRPDPSRRSLAPALVAGAVVCVVTFALAVGGSTVFALGAGIVALALGWWVVRARLPTGPEESRRAFLRGTAVAGLGLVAGGAGLGRIAARLARSDPTPVLDGMARDVGSPTMRMVKRGYHPGRSGDLQLLLAPFNTSNYRNESMALSPRDPRTSHAQSWGYLDRVPIAVYAPGIVAPLDSTEEVTLADLAPTAARLIGSSFRGPEGAPLPGIPRPGTAPKLVVTFVIDGGGWNVLRQWPNAWPNLRALLPRSAVYRNAHMGSFPTVTACAHATIGTGAFPRTHGISGHNMRRGHRIVKAWGADGRADPSVLLSPTLADHWSEESGRKAWIGEIGYQIWHLGMIGRGGERPLGRLPVAVYWDETGSDSWQSQNPELYRMPGDVPPKAALSRYLVEYHGPVRGALIFREGGKRVCCSPPIVRYQGDLIAATFDAEPVGRTPATSLLYVNYKMPDYAGHVYNMLSVREAIALQAVDRELGRLRALLEQRFRPGEFALIVTADHGQCPLPDALGGVRLDPIQLADSIDAAFGRSLFPLVQDVKPSEVYLDGRALWDSGVRPEDVAAHLAGYRYRDNVGPYVPREAVEWNLLGRREFAAVFPAGYIGSLPEELSRFGPGRFPDADPGIPSL